MDPATPERVDMSTPTAVSPPGAEPDLTGVPGPLRRALDRFWRLRDRAVRTAIGRFAWKIAIALIGFVIVVVGIVLLPLPGPGWLIIFAGLGVWATEFDWASRLLAWTKVKVRVATSWIGRWPRSVKGAAAALCVAAIYPLWLGYRVVRDWM
jgi:uncharacterized protein (TIGR02611 family)